MPEISIIVPVYKVEKYLERCVKSILAQTFTDFELILVDDGSPDNCPLMCDEWAKKDKRIKVIHKANGGAGQSRNVGLENATGKYIGFVDADDWITRDMYEYLHELIIKEDADVAMCDFTRNPKELENDTLNEEIKVLDFKGIQDFFIVLMEKQVIMRYGIVYIKKKFWQEYIFWKERSQKMLCLFTK